MFFDVRASFKRYLGDGVYGDYDGSHIILTTENGYEVTNTIALDSKVLEALENFKLHIIDYILSDAGKADNQ